MAPLVRHSCMLRRLRSFFSRERLAGVDPFGNEYYEILNCSLPGFSSVYKLQAQVYLN